MNTTIEKNKVKHHLKLMINISISKYESDLRMNEHYLGVVKKRPERNSGLYGIWTHNFCEAGVRSTKPIFQQGICHYVASL